MEVLDAQVHLWELNASGRALDETILNQVGDAVKNSVWEFFRSNSLTASQFVREMDLAKVTGALVVTPTLYRDNSYSLSACRDHPGRYRVVGSVDPLRPDIEELMTDWPKQPGMAGVRIMALNATTQSALDCGAYDALLRGARKGPLTVCILAPNHAAGIAAVARRFDDVQFVVDHLGILPDPLNPSSLPLNALTQTIEALSPLQNVSLKLGNIPALSDSGVPFPDILPHVHRILDSFGPDRVMWASDHSWYLHLPYRTHVDVVRENTGLSETDRQWLLAGALRRAFRWPAGQAYY